MQACTSDRLRSYTDEGGFECSREDYENAAEISFPSDYWKHDKVYILYVTLDDKSEDRLKEALTESASAYFYSTQYDWSFKEPDKADYEDDH